MQENLKAYIDGELSPQQAHQVELALQRDAALRQEFDEMRRISSTLRESSVVAPVVGLDKTLAALKKQGAVRMRPPLLRFAPAAGVVFACALALVMIGKMNGHEAPFNDESPGPASKKDVSAPVPAMSAAGTAATTSSSGGGESVDGFKNRDGDAQSHGTQSDMSLGVAPAPMVAGEPESMVSARGTRPMSTLSRDNTRKDIVKTGDLHLSVPHGKEAMTSASELAKGLGGLVESSELNGDDRIGMTGKLTLRVRVATFDRAMAGLEKLGKVTGVSSTGNDVTSEIAGNDAKLQTMHVQEQDYMGILKQAKHVQDVLAVKEQLDEVQQELAELNANQKVLKRQAAMSTISVTITQPAQKVAAAAGPVRKDWLDGTWKGAWTLLAVAGRAITAGLIYLVVFCPIWIPIVVLSSLVARRKRLLA